MTTPGRPASSVTASRDPAGGRFQPPRFGLSGSPIGDLPDPGGNIPALATVDAAYEAGIRFFDTAPHYGPGRSERRLGAALARRPRGEYLVATRVGQRVEAGGSRPDLSAAGVRRSVAASLERLGLESLDLVVMEVTDAPWREAIDQAYPVLHELREQGVMRAVGVAVGDAQALDRFVRQCEIDAVLLTVPYSLLDQAGEPLLERCHAHGVPAIAPTVAAGRKPTAGHALGTKDAPAIGVRRIHEVCEQYDVTPAQAALAFPARHPAVSSVLISATSAAEIRAQAALVRRPVPAALWRELKAQRLVGPYW
jgi:D-threo-aldose 1-dehydrogenase